MIMRITACSSAFFTKETYEIKKKLEEKGHEVFVYPSEVEVDGKTVRVEDYYRMRKNDLTPDLLKIKTQLIDKHIKKIKNSDAILVLNFDKGGEAGYIGGNTFLEMAIAYFLDKKIFSWKKPSENLPYFEEVAALNPIIIEEDLEKIR